MSWSKEDRRAYRRIYDKRRYDTKMQLARDYFGGKCSKCGSKDNLQLDHRDPTKKTRTLSSMAASYSLERFTEELKKCQLLCWECHKKKTREDFGYEEHAKVIQVRCNYCGKTIDKTYGDIGYKLRQGQKNFYCDRSCAGSVAIQKNSRRKKRYDEDIPHGDVTKYSRGCRCTLCRQAKANYYTSNGEKVRY